MRKGYGDSSGGDFKMEVECTGEVSCYYFIDEARMTIG